MWERDREGESLPLSLFCSELPHGGTVPDWYLPSLKVLLPLSNVSPQKWERVSCANAQSILCVCVCVCVCGESTCTVHTPYAAMCIRIHGGLM